MKILIIEDDQSVAELERDYLEINGGFQCDLHTDGTQETIQLVTTLRQDALKGLISKESPVGKALLGHKVGDRVKIQVSDTFAYYVQIQQVEKTGEDPDLPISTF